MMKKAIGVVGSLVLVMVLAVVALAPQAAHARRQSRADKCSSLMSSAHAAYAQGDYWLGSHYSQASNQYCF